MLRIISGVKSYFTIQTPHPKCRIRLFLSIHSESLSIFASDICIWTSLWKKFSLYCIGFYPWLSLSTSLWLFRNWSGHDWTCLYIFIDFCFKPDGVACSILSEQWMIQENQKNEIMTAQMHDFPMAAGKRWVNGWEHMVIHVSIWATSWSFCMTMHTWK